MTDHTNGTCPCAATTFTVNGEPIVRGFCHCTICQEFNGAPFADITMFRAADVTMPPEGQVSYRSYARPGLVQRGVCVACGKPAIEYMKMPLVESVVIIPTANLSDSRLVPEPTFHAFYHRRVDEADDALPKYSGYLRSQLAFGRLIKAGLDRLG